MWRLTERIVRSTLVTGWRLATSPTSTSPLLANAQTDGGVRDPSAFAMTSGSPPVRTATTELVVPRSIPTARAIDVLLLLTVLLVRRCLLSCIRSYVVPAILLLARAYVKRTERSRLNFHPWP